MFRVCGLFQPDVNQAVVYRILWVHSVEQYALHDKHPPCAHVRGCLNTVIFSDNDELHPTPLWRVSDFDELLQCCGLGLLA